MKGYKVFNPDWTCREFKYEVGKTYKHDGDINICNSGFHFCEKASDCFNYYRFDSDNKVAEVIAHGKILNERDKSVTDEIEIIREVPWQELLAIVNEGRNNTGLCNTGYWNTGDHNTGYRNTGYRNTGDRNTGDHNTGYRNTGYRNTGDRNTGDWNTGDRNTGDWNTGDWNTTNFSSGVFCTEKQKALFFDKPSDMTLSDWRNHGAYWLLNQIQTVFWCCSKDMTDTEKELHPEHETTGGFLKTIHIVEAAEKWLKTLSENDKDIIRSIPNYDADKFEKIVGVRIVEAAEKWLKTLSEDDKEIIRSIPNYDADKFEKIVGVRI